VGEWLGNRLRDGAHGPPDPPGSEAPPGPALPPPQVFFKYRIRNNFKDGEYLGPRLGDKVFIVLLIMSLYWGVGDKEGMASGVTNIAAVLFMWSTMPGFGAAAYVPAITLERGLYVRERNDGLYTPITYLLCKLLEEALLAVPVSLVGAAIVFYSLQLAGSFALFWLTYIFTLLCGIILAYAVASASPNMDVANAALPTYVVTLLFFGGFLIRFPDMPRGWRWYSAICFLRYSWGAQMVNQFEDNDTIFADGKTILQFYDLDGASKWGQCCVLLAFFGAFFVLAWMALYIKHQKR